MKKLWYWQYPLRLRHAWSIAGGAPPRLVADNVFVCLQDEDGHRGLGEAAPARAFGEDLGMVLAFLDRVVPGRLNLDDPWETMRHLRTITPFSGAGAHAVQTALLDLAAGLEDRPLHRHLGLGFENGFHETSMSLGLDSPERVRIKLAETGEFGILKVKVGGRHDRETLMTVRKLAPGKRLYIDANEAWSTADEALRNIRWLEELGNVELVEQPMPRNAPADHMRRVKEGSRIPLFADESFRTMEDLGGCLEFFHGVNVKLAKCGGPMEARRQLEAAREAGLRTMIGCYIESSLSITAAAHLCSLADHVDLDGNLLISNDPWQGVRTVKGRLHLSGGAATKGLGVRSNLV